MKSVWFSRNVFCHSVVHDLTSFDANLDRYGVVALRWRRHYHLDIYPHVIELAKAFRQPDAMTGHS